MILKDLNKGDFFEYLGMKFYIKCRKAHKSLVCG